MVNFSMLSVILGKGNGTFQPATDFGVENAGRLRRGGGRFQRRRQVRTWPSPAQATTTVSVYTGLGNGTFAGPVALSARFGYATVLVSGQSVIALAELQRRRQDGHGGLNEWRAAGVPGGRGACRRRLFALTSSLTPLGLRPERDVDGHGFPGDGYRERELLRRDNAARHQDVGERTSGYHNQFVGAGNAVPNGSLRWRHELSGERIADAGADDRRGAG